MESSPAKACLSTIKTNKTSPLSHLAATKKQQNNATRGLFESTVMWFYGSVKPVHLRNITQNYNSAGLLGNAFILLALRIDILVPLRGTLPLPQHRLGPLQS